MTETQMDRTPSGDSSGQMGASTAVAEAPITLPGSVSVVIACRNEAKHIQEFMDSVLAQDLADFDWEIIVADGASDDGTRYLLSQIARANPRIVLLDNPSRIVSTGLNAAIKAAHGEIILRMDAHTEYARNYVRKCVETLEATGAQNVGGPASTKAEGLSQRAIQAAYHSRFSTGGARFHDASYTGYVDTVTYGCWRKETLLKLGLYDEHLVRNQDDELNLRLTRSGGKIWQSSDIISWYRPRATLSALFKQYFQYGFWKVPVIRKHRIPGSWRHLMPGAFVVGNLVLLLATVYTGLAGFHARSLDIFFAWVAVLAVYGLGCLAASALSARRYGWELFPYLPMTFAVFHFSYGLGFLLGSIYWTFVRTKGSRLGDLFVGVTR